MKQFSWRIGNIMKNSTMTLSQLEVCALITQHSHLLLVNYYLFKNVNSPRFWYFRSNKLRQIILSKNKLCAYKKKLNWYINSLDLILPWNRVKSKIYFKCTWVIYRVDRPQTIFLFCAFSVSVIYKLNQMTFKSWKRPSVYEM